MAVLLVSPFTNIYPCSVIMKDIDNKPSFCVSVTEQMVRYPKFMGTGNIAFPVLRGSYREFTMTVEFRPDTGNGLLLFSSEYPNAKSDFFSLSLVDNHLQFR